MCLYTRLTLFAGCVADVVFVVDRSGSVGPTNFEAVRRYLIERVERAEFTGPGGNRFGVVAYDSSSRIECALSHNESLLLSCIRFMPYTGGGTNTADAIRTARLLHNGTQANRSKVIDVITDGASNNRYGTLDQASIARSTGIIMIGTGVGRNMVESELIGLASEPKQDHWTNVGSFVGAAELAEVISGMCPPRITGGATRQWSSLCPVAQWSMWSNCSAACGGGIQTRTRQSSGAATCAITTEQTQACNIQACPSGMPRNCVWSGLP